MSKLTNRSRIYLKKIKAQMGTFVNNPMFQDSVRQATNYALTPENLRPAPVEETTPESSGLDKLEMLSPALKIGMGIKGLVESGRDRRYQKFHEKEYEKDLMERKNQMKSNSFYMTPYTAGRTSDLTMKQGGQVYQQGGTTPMDAFMNFYNTQEQSKKQVLQTLEEGYSDKNEALEAKWRDDRANSWKSIGEGATFAIDAAKQAAGMMMQEGGNVKPNIQKLGKIEFDSNTAINQNGVLTVTDTKTKKDFNVVRNPDGTYGWFNPKKDKIPSQVDYSKKFYKDFINSKQYYKINRVTSEAELEADLIKKDPNFTKKPADIQEMYREGMEWDKAREFEQWKKSELDVIANADVRIQKSPEGGSYSRNKDSVIFIDPTAKEERKYDRQDIITHELSHNKSRDSRSKSNPAGNIHTPHFRGPYDLSTGFDDYMNKNKVETYHDNPNEYKADVNALRFRLMREGIYDPINQDFNKDHLNKIKSNSKLSKDPIIQRFLRLSKDDDAAIKAMNDITQIDDENKYYAQEGGELEGIPESEDLYSENFVSPYEVKEQVENELKTESPGENMQGNTSLMSWLFEETPLETYTVSDIYDAKYSKPAGGEMPISPVLNTLSQLGLKPSSVNTGEHSPNSRHYHNKAVDLGLNTTFGGDQRKMDVFYQYLQSPEGQKMFPGVKVRDERTRPNGQKVWSGSHLHLELN